MAERTGIVCAGNWIVDIVHTIDHWPNKSDLARIRDAVTGIGGGAANVSAALKALYPDLPIWPAGRIGEDAFGDMVLQHCQAKSMPTDFFSRDAAAPTAHTHVMNVPGDARTFFYQGGANDTYSIEHIDCDFLAETTGARLFYFGYLLLLARFDQLQADGSTMAAKLLEKARATGMTVCVDLVSASHPDFSVIVKASLPQIDYLILNEVEAGRTLQRNINTVADMENAAAELLELGVQNGVIIHSATDAIWANGGTGAFHRPALAVSPKDIVSPVGAGDAFCAGILFGLHEGWSVEQTLTLAHSAAAASLRNRTATEDIPKHQELMKL